MTLKEAIEAEVRKAEEQRRNDPEGWDGGDWWQLWDEEALVFGIEPDRWPRMMTAWLCFRVFHGLADVGEDEAPVALLQAERKRRPDIEFSHDGFDTFSSEYAGLTFREADAAYGKMHFTNVRHGIIQYRDEEEESE